MESWLWNPGFGILAVESWLWKYLEVSGGIRRHLEAAGRYPLAGLAGLPGCLGWLGLARTIWAENIDFSLIFTVFEAATERLA